jgi:NADH-quinone oxidoreductase subunit L
MTAALGAGAYSAGIFHLMTHAFFKALLFLGAGSVIIAMHHRQDMREMGGLRKYMPVTYWTMLIGTLALIGFPGMSGFFSKDLIIEAVLHDDIEGATYAYWCLLLGVFVTALYSFRLLFLTFHGRERMDEHTREHLHESPAVVTVPLIALAVPSIAIGWMTVDPVVVGEFFKGAITLSPDWPLAELGEEFHGSLTFVMHGLASPATWMAAAGTLTAWFLYIRRPEIPGILQARFFKLHRLLANKYYFDWFNEHVVAVGVRAIGRGLWKRGDERIIDGWLVNGSANAVGFLAGIVRHVQSGYLYHYAFAMVIGLSMLLAWLLLKA